MRLTTRKAIVILAGLLLVSSLVCGQQKRRSKPKPDTDPLDIFLTGREDELLYTFEEQKEILWHGGWRLLSRGAKGSDHTQSEAYYDRARIERLPHGFIRTWLKYATTKESKLQQASMALEEYDCSSVRTRTLTLTTYDGDGNAIGGDSSPGKWRYIVPETVGESIFGVLCRKLADAEQRDMELAIKWFMEGRQDEKKGKREHAVMWYEIALEYAPGNQKIISALTRVRPKAPLPPPSQRSRPD